jgi:hypothetical protein
MDLGNLNDSKKYWMLPQQLDKLLPDKAAQTTSAF